MPPGACYRVDNGIKLKNPMGLTVYGGTYRTSAVPKGQDPHQKGHAVFDVIGGSHVTLEALQISGVNPGGYHPRLAFDAGIDLQGTSNVTVHGVTVTGTYGDGITLSPLRAGANHNSGTILAPASSVTIEDVTVSGVGRQGLTLASAAGVRVTDLVIENPGLNTFDIEADQWNEGARNVVIDGCQSTGGMIFFANGGAGNAANTHDVTVEHCTMTRSASGSALFVKRPSGSGGPHKKRRGPFAFVADTIRCGDSVYAACVQLSGADVSLSDSSLTFSGGTVHEAVYSLSASSRAVFTRDVVKGYGREGSASRDSSVRVEGGVWRAAGDSATKR